MALRALQRVLGPSPYSAREGINTGGANGVFWLRVETTRPDGLLVVSNVTEGARRQVEAVTTAVESGLIYPLLRGREVSRWSASPSLQLLVTHHPGQRLNAISIAEMQTAFPNAYQYLVRFRSALESRGGWEVKNLMRTGPFYSMSEVGDYTFAPYKLVWKEQSSRLECAVVASQDGKPIIPDHKLMLVPFDNPDEAYFVCALLNSSAAQLAVRAYIISIQQGTHILRYVAVPGYQRDNALHRELARLGQAAHEASAASLADVEGSIDDASARLWQLTAAEEAEIQRNLEELA